MAVVPYPPRKGEKTYWPSRKYGPNGQSEIFERAEDVPEGWLDAPPPVEEVAAVVVEPPAPLGLTRDEIVAALNEGGIEFKKNAGTKSLHDLLRDNVVAALHEKGEAFDVDADTKTLLGLLTAPA